MGRFIKQGQGDSQLVKCLCRFVGGNAAVYFLGWPPLAPRLGEFRGNTNLRGGQDPRGAVLTAYRENFFKLRRESHGPCTLSASAGSYVIDHRSSEK